MSSNELPDERLAEDTQAMGNLSEKIVVNGNLCSEETTMTKLDLDRPSSPETLEKPLGLQLEDDTVTASATAATPVVVHVPGTSRHSSPAVEPSLTDLSVGDLVYAQVPSHPYWPAVITRDPDTDVPFRHFGRVAGREQWHVHFLGCNGIRAWVSQCNMFPYNREIFEKKKSEVMRLEEKDIAKTKKTIIKAKKKAYIISPHNVTSWNSANNEAESLLSASRADRLEYLSSSTAKFQPAPRLSVAPSDFVTQPAKKPRLSATSPSSAKKRTSKPKSVESGNLADIFKNTSPKNVIPPKMNVETTPSHNSTQKRNSLVLAEPSAQSAAISSPVPPGERIVKQNAFETVKKKKGRPRKQPLSTPPLEKRKRGRPRKNSLPVKLDSSNLQLTPSGRIGGMTDLKDEDNSQQKSSETLETSADESPLARHRKKGKNSPRSPEKILRQTKLNFKVLTNSAKPRNDDIQSKAGGQSTLELVKGSKKKSSAAAGPQDASGRVPKESSVSSTGRKKNNLFSGYKDIKLCTICLKENNVVKCRGPCSLYMHMTCADKYRFESPAKLFGILKPGKKQKNRCEKRMAKNVDSAKNASEVPKMNGSADKDSETVVPKREETPQSSESDCLGFPSENSSPSATSNEMKERKCNGDIDRVSDDDGLDLHLSVMPNELDSYAQSPGLPTPPADSPGNSDTAYDGENELNSSNVNDLKVLMDSEKIARKEGKDKGWWCNMCLEGVLGPCFVCGQAAGNLSRCKIGQCGKVFHLDCLKEWPQKSVQISASGKTTLICPAHECHTCISGNPAALFSQSHFDSKLVRCLRCPATYHPNNHCLPAGVQILSSTQIICPAHYTFNRPIASVNWCCLCSSGGFLILCDRCPNAFHAHCLSLDSPPEGKFICEECETGRFPLYGEVVWAKCGSCKWWPARVMYPHEYTPLLMNAEHWPGDFAVKFFGSNDFYWVFRGRAFSYHEGDAKKTEVQLSKSKSLSRYEELFYIGVQEANQAFIEWSMEHFHHEQTWRPKMKPPLYKKITSNKPIGSVKLNDLALPETLSFCECKAESEDPCGPSTNCLNRILFVECTPDICNVGDKCRNRNFDRKLYPKLMPFYTDSKGWGLKTAEPIKKGDFIIEYVGEVIDEAEYKRRLALMEKNKDENYYFLTLDKDKMLDAGPRGNLARFMNHSCQPNCLTEKWTVGLQTRVGIFAMEDIEANTELVFNYNFTRTELIQKECRCGAPSCAGFIGAKPLKLSRPKTVTDSNSKSAAGRNRKNRKRRRSPSVTSQKGVLDGTAVVAKKATNETHPSPVALEMDLNCFICGNGEPQLDCWHNTCTRTFHLKCVGLLDFPPSKRWLCPSHYCRVCNKDYLVEKCSMCINSYCSAHQEGNIFIRRGKQPKCYIHEGTTNPSEVVVKMEVVDDDTEAAADEIPQQDDCDQKTNADDVVPLADGPLPTSTE
ncbi:AWS [Nesidiocoris tenuis]|uniref:AWS n=1 Tax=Nesidiocoris tenuis TaxID=355587 RepID=A0ABN7AW98_9HEMI|nr:AWS [Nesidiocoris tenuis]